MSHIPELLKNQSHGLFEKAAELLEFRNVSIAVLGAKGIDLEKAASEVDAQFDSENISELTQLANILEKVAGYVADLESENTALKEVQVHQEDSEKQASFDAKAEALGNLGFSVDEVAAMSTLPEATLEKVAHVLSQPASMGSAVGFQREHTDPLLEWILG